MGRSGMHSGKLRGNLVAIAPSAEGEHASPQPGDIMYDKTANKLKVWTGSAWETVTSA